MKIKARLAVALILSVALASIATGTETKNIEPVPQSNFYPVVIPELTPTPSREIIKEPTPQPSKAPKKVQPAATPKVVAKVSKPVSKAPRLTGHKASGVASYYCNANRARGRLSRCTVGYPDGPNSYYAAIRKDLLFLRGRWIQVCEGRNCLRVKIIDCNCGRGANLIDLYGDAFAYFHPLTRGRFDVYIKW